MKTLIGLVKWFDSEKGFGVLGTPDKTEYFFRNEDQLPSSKIYVEKGVALAFEAKEDKKKKRLNATKWRHLSNYEDWKSILQYLDKNSIIQIEVEVRRGRGLSSYYAGKALKPHSLKGNAAIQLFKRTPLEEVEAYIIKYFDEDLKPEQFYSYCKFVEEHLEKAELGKGYSIKSNSSIIKDKVLKHFGEKANDKILFQVWKFKCPKYISKSVIEEVFIQKNNFKENTEQVSFGELILNKNIFKENIDQISFGELKRIYEYDFGKAFCLNYIEERFKGVEDLPTIEIRNLIQLLYLLNDSEKLNLIDKIQDFYVERALSQIQIRAKKIGNIGDNDYGNLQQVHSLKAIYSTGVNSKIDSIIEKEVEGIIRENASEGRLLEAWLDGKVSELSFDQIQETFQNKLVGVPDSHTINRILFKLTVKEQLVLLESVISYTYHKWKTPFTIIRQYLQWINRVPTSSYTGRRVGSKSKPDLEDNSNRDYTNSDLYTKLYEKDFWCKRKGYELLSAFNDLVEANATVEEKINLIKFELISHISVPFSCIESNFIGSTCNHERTRLLLAVPLEQQLKLLSLLKEQISWQETITVFEDFYKSINHFSHHKFSLDDINSTFLKEKKGGKLLCLFTELISNPATEKEMVELYLLGFKEPFIASYKVIKEAFWKEEVTTEVKAKLLFLLEVNEQLELLILYKHEHGWKSTFTLLEAYLKRLNRTSYINFTEKAYWENRKGRDLLSSFLSLVHSSASESEKLELYLADLIVLNDVPTESIKSRYLNAVSESDKVKLFNALPEHEQVNLLLLEKEKDSWQAAFGILGRYINYLNKGGVNLKENLFDSQYWVEKKGGQLITSFNQVVEQLATVNEKYELYLLGLFKNLSKENILENASKFSKEQCLFTFNQFINDKELILSILESKLSNVSESELIWLCKTAIEYLDGDSLKGLHSKMCATLPSAAYIKIWEDGLVSVFPEQHITALLEQDDIITLLKRWLTDDATRQEAIGNILLKYLEQEYNVTDRVIFSRHSSFIKLLLKIDASYASPIQRINNELYNSILWLHHNIKGFNFEILKLKFIYFNPDEQVKIIRKLFWLKATGKFDLTVDHLTELTRFDVDLYKLNQQFNPAIAIDLSTEIIIQVLYNYKSKGKFLAEGELLSIVLKHVDNDKSRRVKLSEYFESCAGRMTAEFNWERNGEIKKIFYGNNQYYYALNFEYQEDIVNKVRLLPNRKWNSEAKHWGVPSRFRDEVLQFAKENRFFVLETESPYRDNPHLTEFKREEVPSGISFCEGRKANKLHYLHNREFWFCAGQQCFQKCETIHSEEDWERYTLLDFCEILELNTDEINQMKDFISKGKYYQFISLINRFNRLIEKLYCHECDEILSPIQSGHFAVNNVVKFSCQNNKCSQLNHVIYLNHCLNGQCNSIIDSRISGKCTHNLYICDQCGSCCSHAMFERRLNSLELGGGYIHAELKFNVEHKTGHLERAECFCHVCSNEMEELEKNVFTCEKCDIKYDTTKFGKIITDRPHRYLPKAKPFR